MSPHERYLQVNALALGAWDEVSLGGRQGAQGVAPQLAALATDALDVEERDEQIPHVQRTC